MNPTVVSCIAFATISLFTAAVATLFRVVWQPSRQTVDQRLSQSDAAPQVPRFLFPASAERTRGIRGRIDDAFDRVIIESGTSMSAESAVLMSVACSLLLGGVLFVILNNLYVAGVGAVCGGGLSIGYLLLKRARRRRQMRDQLPDAVDMLARAVRAGETLEQALTLVGNHSDPPLSVEFKRSASHMGLGLSTEATMRAFCLRVPLTEADILATTLIVQRRAGGNLPRTLESLVNVIRDRLNYHRQFRAATAGARFSAGLMLLAVPLVVAYLFTWQRDYIDSLLFTDIGRGIFLGAVLLQAAGVFWIYLLLKPDY